MRFSIFNSKILLTQLLKSEESPSYIIGGPGYKDYMGSILKSKDNRDELLDLEKALPRNDLRRTKTNSYLGYSLTSGFFDGKSEYVVMSAPRNKNGQVCGQFKRVHFYTGTFVRSKVLVYPLGFLFQTTNYGDYLVEIKGESNGFGEYFGASVLTLDTNNDKFDDLVVGAPLYSNHTHLEVGRVYVFLINEKVCH